MSNEAAAGVVRVPAPPSSFPVVLNFLETDPFQVLHRVHSKRRSADEFNESPDIESRFSPIRDAAGKVVPVLYAGLTPSCAFYESLFHDRVYAGAQVNIPDSKLRERVYSTLVSSRPLRLAKLFGPDLMRLGLTLDQLIHCSPDHYLQTARWAEAIHNVFPEADGLVWTSYRGDPDAACVLFGDRIDPLHLIPFLDKVQFADDPDLMSLVYACAARVGVRITVNAKSTTSSVP
jgi:hypothetical protein